MPNFDGTGPADQGPKTGRQRGNCSGAVPRLRPINGGGNGLKLDRGQRRLTGRNQRPAGS